MPESGWILRYYIEYLSVFQPLMEGGYLVARADMLRKYLKGSSPPGEYSYAGRAGLLAIDSKLKKVSEIAWKDLKEPEYSSSPPILRRFGNRYFSVWTTRNPDESKTYFYISTYNH